MPTIRINDEVYKALKNMAEPFEDSPNDVIERLLRGKGGPVRSVLAHDVGSRKLTRHRRGEATRKEAYRPNILRALVEMGGRGEAADVLKLVERMMSGTLNRFDHGSVSTGEERWRNFARFEKADMVREGLLRPNSPHGIWELTEKGRQHLRQAG
jgi:predicted CopG family antitoxin